MSLELHELAPLFTLSRDAVIGADRENIVRFANPAAEALLSLGPGDSAARVLPRELLEDPAVRFVASAVIAGENREVAVTRMETGSLYILPFRPAGDRGAPLSEPLMAELGGTLMTERLALDRLVTLSGAEEDDGMSPYAAILYRNYYRLKRLHSHASLAAALRRGAPALTLRITALDEVFAGVCRTTELLAKERGVAIDFQAEGTDFFVRGDAGMLETMLFNLLANSLLHTPSGGVIRVRLSRRGDRCVLAVDDTGGGVPPARMAELFRGGGEPALTDAAAGAGLGLELVRGIAEAHGGAVLAESREGAGALFRVSLPWLRPEDRLGLRQGDMNYRPDGMDRALTELSVVLDKAVYNRKYFD